MRELQLSQFTQRTRALCGIHGESAWTHSARIVTYCCSLFITVNKLTALHSYCVFRGQWPQILCVLGLVSSLKQVLFVVLGHRQQ